MCCSSSRPSRCHILDDICIHRIMKDWSIIDRLHKVRVPTFVVNGRADQAQDSVVAPFFQHIPRVKWVTFEKASHMAYWEDREHYMKLVEEFLAN